MEQVQAKEAVKEKEQSITKVAEGLLFVMTNFIKLLNDEIDCLSRRDFEAMGKLRNEKFRLRREYETGMEALAKVPDQVKTLSEETRAQLREVGARLVETAQKNAALLKAAVNATQMLVNTIMSAVSREVNTHESYADPRKLRPMMRGFGPATPAVAVSRTI